MAANPKVQAFYDATKAFNARKQAALTDILGDIEAQAKKIEELNNRPPGWTDEDQALLDDISAENDTIATKLEAAAAIVVPTPPVEPPPTV